MHIADINDEDRRKIIQKIQGSKYVSVIMAALYVVLAVVMIWVGNK